jgi:hypothetical protein
MITKYKLYREQSNLCNESLRDKIKGKSDEDIKKSLGITDNYISVKIWNPKNYNLIGDSTKLKSDRFDPVYTRISGDFTDILDFMMSYINWENNPELALTHFKDSIIKND